MRQRIKHILNSYWFGQGVLLGCAFVAYILECIFAIVCYLFAVIAFGVPFQQGDKCLFWIFAFPKALLRAIFGESYDDMGDGLTVIMNMSLNYFLVRYCWRRYQRRHHRTEIQKDYDEVTKPEAPAEKTDNPQEPPCPKN